MNTIKYLDKNLFFIVFLFFFATSSVFVYQKFINSLTRTRSTFRVTESGETRKFACDCINDNGVLSWNGLQDSNCNDMRYPDSPIPVRGYSLPQKKTCCVIRPNYDGNDLVRPSVCG